MCQAASGSNETTAGNRGAVASLRRSVLTSSSTRPLAEFMGEVRSVTGVSLFDLFILRDVDIEDIERETGALEPPRAAKPKPDARTAAEILAEESNLDRILDWIARQLAYCNGAGKPPGAEEVRIAALATYFPGITARSHNDDKDDTVDFRKIPHRIAERAIANSVRLALRLKQKGLMQTAVVEIVGGTVLDVCECPSCGKFRKEHLGESKDVVFEFGYEAKILLLCERLLAALPHVAKEPEEVRGAPWALGVELEPGPAYVFKDHLALGRLIEELTCPSNSGKYEELLPHVGLNVDIAHMKAAGVSAEDLDERGINAKHWIVHAHLCDQPGMHTRDQAVGRWTPYETFKGEDYPYLKLLAQVDADAPSRKGRPYTRAVALELEGCARIGWTYQSLVAMKHMTEVLNHHLGQIG